MLEAGVHAPRLRHPDRTDGREPAHPLGEGIPQRHRDGMCRPGELQLLPSHLLTPLAQRLGQQRQRHPRPVRGRVERKDGDPGLLGDVQQPQGVAVDRSGGLRQLLGTARLADVAGEDGRAVLAVLQEQHGTVPLHGDVHPAVRESGEQLLRLGRGGTAIEDVGQGPVDGHAGEHSGGGSGPEGHLAAYVRKSAQVVGERAGWGPAGTSSRGCG